MKSAAFALALVALAATACGSPGGEAAPPPDVPHGYVEGAEEAAEAQSRLVVADGDTGAVRVLDLITEEVVELGAVPGVQDITDDGRYAYLTGDGGTRVVDSGSWMVDHGDHVHYYRADIHEVGDLPGRTSGAHNDTGVAVVSTSDGSATLFDRAALDGGTLTEVGRAELAPGTAAVPYETHVLTAAPDGAVRVLDREGRVTGTVEPSCPRPSGEALTRRGVVFGCADGALLVSEDGGAFRGEKIPYPRPVGEDERAREFQQRPGSATLAAKAGEHGTWSLDLSDRKWTHVETGPVVAVNAVGEGGPLLALTADGVLHAHDAETGAVTAKTRITERPVDTSEPLPVIRIDTTRAYVNDVDAGTIHEIDYNDSLRLAREFRLGGKASHLAETGR
ncbi:lipoprotein [Saccharopolyspora gloriosae]|uniref:ABC transporter n=1 Tax=Saccharopolyspora gloriosae TaxID=455344 RepID=A0A840NAA4_9PSEU|nr:hypothetical protein [Saccharopolyspora gloriosae]MBB5068890.1 hypothetical protein [Saccharopolyspora gloriosae]